MCLVSKKNQDKNVCHIICNYTPSDVYDTSRTNLTYVVNHSEKHPFFFQIHTSLMLLVLLHIDERRRIHFRSSLRNLFRIYHINKGFLMFYDNDQKEHWALQQFHILVNSDVHISSKKLSELCFVFYVVCIYLLFFRLEYLNIQL